jgi:hypothetical protein
LFPGEKTKISIKSFRRTEDEAKSASSVLDSWTEESAQDFQQSMEHEQSSKTGVQESSEYKVQGEASASWGWGSASLSGSYNQLNVRTVNERNFDNVTMSAEIIGQVKIGFKTETFPPVTTAAALPAGG